MTWKMIKIFTLLILGMFYFHSFGQTPKNIDEAITYFEKNWTASELTAFKNEPETNAVTDLHFSTGMWIRNEWIRNNKDTSLKSQFNSLGIFHPDDMSSIILTSLHRKLNNIPIDLNGQIEECKAYWKPRLDCEKRINEIAVENFDKYDIGDTINIFMYVDTADGQRNAVLLNCPTIDWEFNPLKDLIVQGIITQKYFLNNTSNVFFKVSILNMNFKNTMILMRKVKVFDAIDFNLEYLRIEPNI